MRYNYHHEGPKCSLQRNILVKHKKYQYIYSCEYKCQKKEALLLMCFKSRKVIKILIYSSFYSQVSCRKNSQSATAKTRTSSCTFLSSASALMSLMWTIFEQCGPIHPGNRPCTPVGHHVSPRRGQSTLNS